MTAPVEVDIPHKLGRDAARARIEKGFGKLAGFIPGSSVTDHRWAGDVLTFTVEAMGQRIGATLTVLDDRVHALFDWPPMLAMFAGKMRDQLAKGGQKLLE